MRAGPSSTPQENIMREVMIHYVFSGFTMRALPRSHHASKAPQEMTLKGDGRRPHIKELIVM